MEAIKLCRLDTPIIFIEARINLSRFVVTGCAAKTSATVTFPSLNLISRSEERFSRNAETDLVCRLLLEKKKILRLQQRTHCHLPPHSVCTAKHHTSKSQSHTY